MTRERLSTTFRLVLVLAGAALVAAACSGGDSGRVTIYSGRTENLIGPILETFAAETGIGVDVRYGQSAQLALQIREEGNRTPADVFLSQSPGAVGFLDQEGLLAPLRDSILDRVEPQFRAKDGTWVGFSGRQRVLVYNTELVDESELPDSVFDLTDPAYAGRVGVAPANGSFQDFVTAMRARLGDDATREWLEAMAANDPRTFANNNAIVAAVGRGEVPMGLVNHYYNFRFLDDDPGFPARNHQFGGDDIGSLVIVTGAAVIEGTDVPDEAQRLVEFLLDERAQRFFSDETFEYPLSSGVEPAEVLPPLEIPSVNSAIDFSQLGGGLEATVSMIEQSGLDES